MSEIHKWFLNIDGSGIAWLGFDCRSSKLNTLSKDALEQLEVIIDELNIDLPKGLVLYSPKQTGFIAGADISEFSRIESVEQAQKYIGFVHALYNRIEAMPIPKVALIHGACLGGGLELSLAFDYLIAEDQPDCKLGLPEVKLGIHPGYGGTVRLIERIGVAKAMDMMLNGRVVSARAAKKLGFVDQITAKRYFNIAARDFIRQQPDKRGAASWQVYLFKIAWLRRGLAGYLDKQIRQGTRPEHYPAPYALIDLWRRFGGNRNTMLAEEINSVARLINTETVRNLVRIFFLQEALKSTGKPGATPIAAVAHLHVIGAGVMGGDIAAWSAMQGIRVTLQDNNVDSIALAVTRAQILFKRKLKIRRRVQAAMDRLIPDTSGAGLSSADLVIEAIFENLEAKQEVLAEAEKKLKSSAILASNTSSIPIEDIASILNKPSRLVGIHFFNPVAKMQLIEVVEGAKTSSNVLGAAHSFTLQIKRLPVGVKSRPGFLLNRVLMPYLIEALRMLDEKESALHIDRAALEFGMPLGPIELVDLVGLDICLHVAENLLAKQRVPQSLKDKVKAGEWGKKSGQGYYHWRKGKPQKPVSDTNLAETQPIAERMIYPLLNECIACLHEGVVANADELDAGVIFGTGFAPFKGGPMKLIADLGRETIIDRLEQLQLEHGSRFKPHEGWENMQLF